LEKENKENALNIFVCFDDQEIKKKRKTQVF